MPETENINTIAGITVKANHDIDMTTVNSGSVALKNASGQAVELESAIAEGEEIKIKTVSTLPNGSYTLALKDTVKDVIGQSAGEYDFVYSQQSQL